LQRPAKEAVRRKKNSFTIILSFPLLPKKWCHGFLGFLFRFFLKWTSLSLHSPCGDDWNPGRTRKAKRQGVMTEIQLQEKDIGIEPTGNGNQSTRTAKCKQTTSSSPATHHEVRVSIALRIFFGGLAVCAAIVFSGTWREVRSSDCFCFCQHGSERPGPIRKEASEWQT
jgi:hypothetical protein